MILSIMTPTEQFANDAADVVRVFFGALEMRINVPGGDMTLTHTESVENGVRTVTVTVSGLAGGSARRLHAVEADALEDKRYHKRQIKQCVYSLMKEATGRTPPWGSLTGIRPTRLIYLAMENGLTPEAAARQVRDEFDVRADKCSLLLETVNTQSLQPAPGQDEVDLYVGIPFCVSRCAYCSFLSGEVGSGKQLPPYVEALENEIRQTLALIDEKGLKPRTFYMGGGTPTSLSAPMLERVLKAARPFIDRVHEVTVEAGRPDTIDRDKLQVILDAGGNRISVNPQTKHDVTLERIGRRHTCAQTEEAYALARKMGFGHINMDLIAGLPGETRDMIGETLSWIESLAPESMTVHTLSIKHSSLLHLWQSALPDGGIVEDMVTMGRESAAAQGMTPYYLYRQKYMAGNLENVGYALPGHACLYNIGMMEETAHVLAVGAGAISKRVAPKGGLIRRAPNVSDIGHYIERADEMARRKRELWSD